MSHRARAARRLLGVAGAVLLAAAVIAIVVAVRAQRSAPQPPASAARFVPARPDHTAASAHRGARPAGHAPQADKAKGHHGADAPAVARAQGPVLPRSRPVRLDIPAIGVHTSLLKLGLKHDGSIQVPPLSRNSRAGWYRFSPAPGQVGPSVILGHVDSAAYGPGVFFRLGDLRQRDRVSVTRADGSVAVFRVEKVAEYRKRDFPTLQVYGNTRRAALRLITCGGAFDSATGNYLSNIVAYAALVGSHPAHQR